MFSHSAGKSKIKVLAGLISGNTYLPGSSSQSLSSGD
jgi:hypothetical protein